MIKIKSLLILIVLLLLMHVTRSQSFGVGLAYATSNSLNIEVLYKKENSIFKFGGSFEFSDTRGKSVDEQLPNYGQTTDGSGKYFWTIDLGYGRVLSEKFMVDGELSFGGINHYTNYLDDRFNDGGYHLITKRQTIIGVGINAGYFFHENWCAFTGFNTTRKLQFGIRWII